MRWFWLVVVLTSCRRDPVVTEDPTPAKKKVAAPRGLLERYPIPKRMTSKNRMEEGGVVKNNRREEVCTRVDETPPTWNCEAKETGDDPYENTMRYRLLPEGLAYDAMTVGGATLSISPPKVALPLDVHVGSQWSGEHTTGGKKHSRACDVRPLPTCEDGLSVTCVTRYEDGRVITVNNRYCGGTGYVGSESILERADGKKLKTVEDDVRAFH